MKRWTTHPSTGRWLDSEVAWTRTSIPKLLISPYIGRGLPSSPMRQIISSFQVTPTRFPKLGLLDRLPSQQFTALHDMSNIQQCWYRIT